jgi:hypothetical protein
LERFKLRFLPQLSHKAVDESHKLSKLELKAVSETMTCLLALLWLSDDIFYLFKPLDRTVLSQESAISRMTATLGHLS